MVQKDYIIKHPMLLCTVISDIKDYVNTTPHKEVFISIIETSFPEKDVRVMVDAIRMALPEAKIAGISVAAIADIRVDGKGIRINVLLAESSDIEVFTFPCEHGNEPEPAGVLNAILNERPLAKAVFLLSCDMGLNVTNFIETSMEGHEDIPLFGTMTSRRMPSTMSVGGIDRFNIFKVGEILFDRSQCVIGDDILTCGFVAAVFSGEELNVQSNYVLGWHAIGREMDVTLGAREGMGETVVREIDGMPAVNLFNEYLGVLPNENLISNICEFPLMINRNGTDICLIPFDYGADGEVYFNTTIRKGEKLRFSFVTHDDALQASMDSCESMDRFVPQALYLIMCGNRINFLKEDAKLEWECFKEGSPEYALIHGSNEIWYKGGKGGILNSAHLAIGMRETRDESHPAVVHDHDSIISAGIRKKGIVPLADRMSVFMNKMTTQLIEVAEEAETANRAKSSFLSNMSHEIRTPINAILGMDEMILRESGEDAVIKYAEDIRSAGSSLLGIVNDILDFSKIEAGKLSIIKVEYEFSSVINDLYNLVRKRASDKGLAIKWEVDPTIPSILYGDEIRLKQVITNIMTNAVKYTETGTITVTIRKDKIDKTKVEDVCTGDLRGKACLARPVKLYISVKDTGIGIREEDREKLFSAFERVDEKRNRNIEGTGLGLNITAGLLRLMGSQLVVDSVYGEGSNFYFYIVQGIVREDPIGDINERFEKSSKEHKAYRESFTAPDAVILVVDDTPMNLDVMKNLLKRTKIQIETCESGEEALEMVRRKAYDVIFLDHRMPHMDGVECLGFMKEMDENMSKASPVVALTANAISGAREEYLSAGFTDYLTKPIDPSKLEDMLIRYLPGKLVNIVSDDEAADEEEKASVIPEWLKELKGIDVKEGVRNLGDENGYLNVLTNFYTAAPGNRAEIASLYGNEDWENYTIKVHALKSSARIVGAAELSERARLLEMAGNEKDIETIERDNDSLLKLYDDVIASLSPLGDESVDDLPEADPDEVSDAFIALIDFAGAMDYELTRMVLDSMKEYRLKPEDKKVFDEIEKLLMSLDWDGIKKVIEERKNE